MKTHRLIRFPQLLTAAVLLLLFMGCERDISDLDKASFPAIPEVFIDDFSAGLNYAAFGGSVPTAFDVDRNVTYNNSAASMRFEVPDAGDPNGTFAGGVFFTDVGRDLSGFNALTFWAKASQSAVIGEIGFGNDLGSNKTIVSWQGLTLGTGWRKYVIPIPDPSRLTAERGMLWYAAGNMEGKGFTFWIDEVKFEKLGTIAHPQYTIFNGEDLSEMSFVGVKKAVSGFSATFNMPAGINQMFSIAPAYFAFDSSDPSIATVDETGLVTITGGPGTTRITARVGETLAKGSLAIQSIGVFQQAPTPVHKPENVISIFSEAYNNVPVDYYNGYWEPWQTTTSADFEVNGDRILHYVNFNFVGIQFSSPTLNATAMTHLHADIFIPTNLSNNARFRIELVNFVTGGTGLYTATINVNQSRQWISLDIPLSAFTGWSGRANLAQIIFVDVDGNIPSFYADNIYFYNDGSGPPQTSGPTTPPPTPAHDAAKVMAIYSDKYTVIAGTDFYPNWGQTTVVSEMQIQGVKVLKYQGLNYQGIQLGSNQNVSAMQYLHLDFWTANSTQLNVFLISPGPVETAYSLTVPTNGWSSIDIPLSAFSPVNLNEVFQLKFDGNGDIFLGNIYFHRN